MKRKTMKAKKNTRGGKRDGAGRKPLGYATRFMRVPDPLFLDFKQQVANFKAKHK